MKTTSMHLLKSYAKKHFPDICLTLLAAALAALLILAFIVTVPRALDSYEARSQARHAAINDIYNGQ
jgi:hypothetical protein